MRLAFIIFKLSKDPDFLWTDGWTEGKPIVPSGVNTGRGLISLRINASCAALGWLSVS